MTEQITTEQILPGTVYIASMNMRGQWADCSTIENRIVINVTWAQAKNNINRLDYSPMTPIAGGYPGGTTGQVGSFWNFESYWQAGKVYAVIPRETTLNYWLKCKEAKRRYPGSKGKQVLYAEFNGKRYDYVESRKQIYVPEYYNLIKNKQSVRDYREQLRRGKNIIVYDFDGPRTANGGLQCLPVELALYEEKISNTAHPFGHGYVVAGTIAGLLPDAYIV